MGLKIKCILAALITAITFTNAFAGKQQAPRVFALDPGSLIANKKKIQHNDATLVKAYKELSHDADNALQFAPVSVMEKKNIPPSGDRHDYMSLAPYHWPDPTKPGGLPYIRRDGETNPEVAEYKDKDYQPKLCSRVYELSLAYFFSGKKEYAKHAAKLLRVWFIDTATRMNPNMNFAQAIKGENAGRGAGVIDARHYIKVVDAIGLLQGSGEWTASDNDHMRKWFGDFLHWMHTSKNGIDEGNTKNNHGVWYDALRLSLALFIDSSRLAKEIVYHAQERLDKQMNNSGRFTQEMDRTTSFHYSVFIMDAFLTIAAMAEKTGIEMWKYKSPSGKSIRRGFEALLPYLSKQKKWDGQQIKEFDYEEGYLLLTMGSLHFGCTSCNKVIKDIAGTMEQKLLLRLLY